MLLQHRGSRLIVGATRKIDFSGETRFKFLQVLRIDLGVLPHELVHFARHLTFNLQLLQIGDFAGDGVLAEEVAHKHLLDVGLFAEA